MAALWPCALWLRWRYDGAVPTCAWCDRAFPTSGRRRFDTNACRQAAYRARTAGRGDAIERHIGDRIVYECPGCQERFLERRCPECNLFCRRIGPGGACPHCQELVAHADLDD